MKKQRAKHPYKNLDIFFLSLSVCPCIDIQKNDSSKYEKLLYNKTSRKNGTKTVNLKLDGTYDNFDRTYMDPLTSSFVSTFGTEILDLKNKLEKNGHNSRQITSKSSPKKVKNCTNFNTENLNNLSESVTDRNNLNNVDNEHTLILSRTSLDYKKFSENESGYIDVNDDNNNNNNENGNENDIYSLNRSEDLRAREMLKLLSCPSVGVHWITQVSNLKNTEK